MKARRRHHPANARKVGLPPGTPLYTGERQGPVRISLIDYGPDHLQEREVLQVAELAGPAQRPSVTWVTVDGVHDLAKLAELGKVFHLHPLVLEDISHPRQRAKLEDFGEYLYFVCHLPTLSDDGQTLRLEQASFVLSRHFLLLFLEDPLDPFDALRQRIRLGHGRIRGAGNDYLLYALLDITVDNYLQIMDRLSDELGELEEAVMTRPLPAQLTRLHQLRHMVLLLRKKIGPLREIAFTFERGELAPITASTRLYCRDLVDHLLRLQDTIENTRDLLASVQELHLSLLGQRTNEAMKTLTIISTIFIPMSFIAGVYGMNFDRSSGPWSMPELSWPWGYPLVLAVMLTFAVTMLLWFRRRQWL